MPKATKEKIYQICARLPKETYLALEHKAKIENITKSDYVNQAIRNELYKEVNISNEQLGALQELLSQTKKTERKLDTFSSVFLYFLKYFFTAHAQDFNKENVGNLNIAFEKGEKQRDSFIKFFKQENRHMTNLIEAMLADYIAQDV